MDTLDGQDVKDVIRNFLFIPSEEFSMASKRSSLGILTEYLIGIIKVKID